MSRLILLDNTVMSNFAQAQVVSAVYELWGPAICTTPDTFAEYQSGVSAVGLPPHSWDDLFLVEQTKAEKAFGESLSARLGKGERSCLSIACKRGAIFATDDLFARKVAQQYKVTVIGTIGILLLCLNRSILSRTQTQTALEKMIAFGYRSPIDDLGIV